MVVLLIVALSTATLAWFSSNDTVSATQTTMTAARSSDATIGIGWSAFEAMTGTEISFDTPSIASGEPIMPILEPHTTPTTPQVYYVATNKKNAVGLDGVVADGVNGQEFARVFRDEVVAANKSIALADMASFTFVDEKEPVAYDKVYMVKEAIEAGYYVFRNNYPVTGYNLINGYQYLTIVASGAVAGQINLADLTQEPYVGFKGEAAPQAGDRLYDLQAADAEYQAVDYMSSLTAGTFVTGGMGDGQDYKYALTTVGEFETEDNGITLTEAAAFSTGALDGEYIYCIRAAVEEPVTKLSDFHFTTAKIDGSGRFLSAGDTGLPAVLQELGDGTRNTFFIRNNGAPNAAAAEIIVTANITELNSAQLRLAIFAKAPGETELRYYGTLSAAGGQNTVFGTILNGAHSAASQKYTTTRAIGEDAGVSLGSIQSGEPIEVTVIAWFDGLTLTTARGGDPASFTLNITAKPIV